MTRSPIALSAWRAVLVVLACALSHGAARADILIKNVTLYDGTGAPAVKGANVLVKGERIAKVSNKPISAGGATVIDGTGKYLIPGMMDSHIHLRGGQGGAVGQGAERKPINDRVAGITALQGYLYSGITSVYDSGNNPDFIFPLRADERAGKIVSPRIFAAGGVITVPGGYAAGPTALKATTWEDTQKALADKIAREKPDMLKLILEGQGGKVPTLSEEMFRHITGYAHQNGYRTTVHISAEQEAEEAARNGVTAEAHPVLRAPPSDAFLKLLVSRKIPVSTTMSVFASIAQVADNPGFFDEPLFKATMTADELNTAKGPERQRYITSGMSANFTKMMPAAFASIKKYYDSGVTLTSGTDRTIGAYTHMEFALLNKAGIPARDIIKIATLNGAIYIGRQKDLGSVEAGKYADLVLLKSDPAADVKNLQAIDTVIKNGQRIDLAALDLPVNHQK